MRIVNFIRIHNLGMAIATGLALSMCALGQGPRKIAQVQQENNEKLREYTWKMRTEIQKGGETKVLRLDQVRYAVDGSLQQTQLSSTAPELPTGGLRGMIAKKKKEEFVLLTDGLKALAKSYGRLPVEKMQRFMENASITPETTAQQKLMRISGSDVLQPGDSMSIWIDPTTRQQRKVEVRTALEGKPVRIVSEFKELPGGLTYLARAVIEYPSETVVITTDNFDYARQGAVGGGGAR